MLLPNKNSVIAAAAAVVAATTAATASRFSLHTHKAISATVLLITYQLTKTNHFKPNIM